jgi:outer membrane protein OmpA-like peptidoglycan-associated protein
MRTTQKQFVSIAIVCVAALLLGGCASKKYVDDGIATHDAKVADLEGQVEANQRRIAETGEKINSVEGQARDAERIGKDAGSAAQAADAKAGQALEMARGKLLYKIVLSDVAGRFEVDQATLGDDGKSKLDSVAGKLKSENASVYLEIEGHTDSSGPEGYNLTLGQKRAETVRRYLNTQHGIPLHRMSVISYGESKPVADNGTREGRAQNRRVEVKVLS